MQEDYHIERNFLFATSRDRDIVSYPTTTEFKIELPEEYHDIVCVELTAGTVPNLDNVTNDPYLLLDIRELNHVQASNGCDYFSILSVHKGHSDAFFNMDRSSSAMMPHKLYSPKQRLSSLYIKLLHADGSPLIFGTSGTVDPLHQTSFTFEIKTLKKDRRPFDNDFRRVF